MTAKYSSEEAIQRREAGLTDRLEPQEFLRLCAAGGEHFQTVDLSGADLSGASLPSLSLYGSNLKGTNLSGATIAEGSNLRETDMRGAILNQADLTGVNLSLANLSNADLRGANLTRTHLYRTILTNARLDGVIFDQIEDISEVNLEGAQFNGCNLGGIQAGKAVLRRADLSHCNLQGAWLIGSDLQDACLEDVNLEGAQIGASNLRGCNLSGANLRSANLVTTNLEGADLRGADLTGANTTNAKIEGARLEGAILPPDMDPNALKLEAARRAVAAGKAFGSTSARPAVRATSYPTAVPAQSLPGSWTDKWHDVKEGQRRLLVFVGIHMIGWLAAYLMYSMFGTGGSLLIFASLAVVQWRLLQGSLKRFLPAVIMNLAGGTLLMGISSGNNYFWQYLILFGIYMWALSGKGVKLWAFLNAILGTAFAIVSPEISYQIPDWLAYMIGGGLNAAIIGAILFLKLWKGEQKLELKLG